MTRALREARVDLDAIAHNVRTLRRSIGDSRLMTVVKARGYGHGAVEVARAAIAAGSDWLGVADVTEALELRRAGIGVPILAWLHGAEADFDEAIVADIDLGVHYLDQLDRVANAAGTAWVQLKVDTGLSRNGAAEPDWPALFAAAATHERAGRLRVRGIWSHLANAGEFEDLQQVATFQRALAEAARAGLDPELRHLAATAGALRVPAARFSLVRIGIGTYGLSPFDDASSADLGLRPALELSGGIVSVKRVAADKGVSYGHDYRTGIETTLALVPLGYGDGVPRQASDRGPVLINGKRYRIAGRVAMDQFVVDVGDDPVAVGDRAVLFGDPSTGAPSAEDWARAADTINYDIVTRLGGRIEWTYAARD